MAGRRPEEEACAKIFPARKRCLRGAGQTSLEIDFKTSNTEAKTKKTTSTSTSIIAVIDDVTKVREQIDSSSFVNNRRKWSETKKKSMLDPSWHVCCRGTATTFDVIAMPSRQKKGKASLALRSFDVDEERARTAARKK